MTASPLSGSPPTEAPRRPRISRGPLALAALALVLFVEPLFFARVLFERDISTVWHGQVESFVRTIRAGSWPLWDPWVAFGHPMLANANMQVLYPPAWLSLVVPPAACYAWLACAHVLFGGLGTWALARRLRLSEGAALCSGALFLASGPLLSLVNVWHHLAGASWIPWVLLATERCLAQPGSRWAVLLGLALAAPLLAGSPDMFAMTAVVVGFSVVAVLASGEAERRRARLAAAALAAVVALGAGAGQWLPTLAAALDSDRAALPETMRTAWSVHPLSLLELVSPVPGTDLPLSDAVRARLYDSGRPMVHSLYLGLPALAFVAAAFLGQASSRRRLLAAIVVLAALYALGSRGPVYGVLTAVLPPLRALRYPSKAMAFVAVGWALLAGFGFDRWGGERRTWPRPWRLTVGGLVLLATATAGTAAALAVFRPQAAAAFLLSPEALGTPLRQALEPAAAKLARGAVLGATVLVLALRARSPKGVAVAAGLAVLDLVLANHGLNPTAPADFYRYRPPALGAIRQDDGSRALVYRYSMAPGPRVPGLDVDNPYRIAGYPPGFSLDAGRALAGRLYLLPPGGAAFGLLSSYDPDLLGLYPRPLATLVRFHERSAETPAYVRLLRLGAVRYVTALHTRGFEELEPLATYSSLLALPIHVFGVRDPLPRTYTVSGARVAEGDEALGRLADPGFDPKREIVLPAGESRDPRPGFTGESHIVEQRPDRVVLESETSDEGFVVLVDTYDRGWRASVDGRPVALLRANVAFRAVSVGPGRHRTEMVYRPTSALVGLAVTALTLAVALGAAVSRKTRAT